MRAALCLFSFLSAVAFPTIAQADDGPRTTPPSCQCNYAGSSLTWLGPEFGLWYVDYSGASPVATGVNPATGQIAYILAGTVPGSYTIPGGATFITTPIQQPAAAYLASLPAPAPIHVNLWHPGEVAPAGNPGPGPGPQTNPVPGAGHDPTDNPHT